MADRYFEIETTNLSNTIKTLSAQLTKLRTANSTMFGNIQELDATWEGPAKDEFLTQFTVDHDTMETLCSTIDKLIEALQSAKDQYESCEGSVGESVNAIRISG